MSIPLFLWLSRSSYLSSQIPEKLHLLINLPPAESKIATRMVGIDLPYSCKYVFAITKCRLAVNLVYLVNIFWQLCHNIKEVKYVAINIVIKPFYCDFKSHNRHLLLDFKIIRVDSLYTGYCFMTMWIWSICLDLLFATSIYYITCIRFIYNDFDVIKQSNRVDTCKHSNTDDSITFITLDTLLYADDTWILAGNKTEL